MNAISPDFIALVELDARISQLSRERISLVQEAETITEHIANLHAKLEVESGKVRALRKTIDQLELEIRSNDDLRQKKKRQLENASNTREYYSFEQELSSLQKNYDQFEDKLFKAWQQLESAQAIYDKAKVEIPAQIEHQQQLLKEIQSSVAWVTQRIESYTKEYAQAEKHVPEELLHEYRAMKANVENPVIPMIKNACSACFYSVSLADVQEIKQNKLVRCKDCYRLLYASTQKSPNADLAHEQKHQHD